MVFGLLFFSIQTQAQQCTGNVTLTSSSGTITDGPGNYNNNQRCTWLVQPSGAQAFSLSFSQFLINQNDTLFIYNGTDSTGTLVGRFNGFVAPAARNLVANALFIKFKTNGNGVLPGFSLDYESSTCSTPSIVASGPLAIPAGQSITLSAPSGAERYIWSNGDSVQNITINTAGTFTVRTVIAGCTSLASAAVVTTVTTCSGNVTLTSPNGAITDGPGNYTNNNNCTWLIQSPGATAYRLTFTQFTINNNDTLKVYNGIDSTGVLVGRYTGITSPGAIIINGSSVFVKFRTNAAGVGAGFAMAYNSSACPAPVITSSGPLATPAGQTITLTTSQVADRYLWSNGDTTQSTTVQTAGTYTLRTVTAGCTSLISNALVTTLVSCAGNVVLNSISGTISDGPGQYDNNSNCTWLIQPTGATSITLNFTGNFNLEANNDLLRIYQGTDTTGTLVATLTGTANPQNVRVIGGAMFVRLTTNANTTRAGFVANYSITTCTFAPVPSITPADSFNLLNTPSRELTASEAPAGMSYLWSTGDTTRSITVTTPGNYSVRIINGACTTAQSNVVIVTNIIPQCSGNVTLTSVTGAVTEGQGQYTNNRRCSWLINPPGATSININFLEMDMESCCDFVDIFDGPDSTFTRIGRFTGATIPAAVTVPGGVAWVRFTSDISLVGSGFTFNYTGVVCPTTPATPTVTPAGPIDL
ncbi:MAG: CUB domain-containing protein, partial [Flexibacteraceae bacterium]